MTVGPFATDAEAAAAARALGGPPEPGWSILSPEQRLGMLTAACEDAGVALGACDARVLAWLAGLEDGICAVVAGLVTRAHAAEAASTRDAVWDDGLLVCSTCGAPAGFFEGRPGCQHYRFGDGEPYDSDHEPTFAGGARDDAEPLTPEQARRAEWRRSLRDTGGI